MREYSGTLRRKIGVHKCVLTTAVPQVEDEVSEKPNVVLLNVDGSAQPGRQRCWIIGTNSEAVNQDG